MLVATFQRNSDGLLSRLFELLQKYFLCSKKIELTARFRRRRLFFCYCIGAWRAKSPFASRAVQRTLLLLYCRPPTRSQRRAPPPPRHCSIVRRRRWRGDCTGDRLPRTQCFLFSVSIETRKQKHYIICIETESKKSFSITSVFFFFISSPIVILFRGM